MGSGGASGVPSERVQDGAKVHEDLDDGDEAVLEREDGADDHRREHAKLRAIVEGDRVGAVLVMSDVYLLHVDKINVWAGADPEHRNTQS